MDKELLTAIGEMLDKKLDEKLDEKLDLKLEPIKQDITGMKQDITGLKKDVTGMKQDITGLKQDVAGMKQDITGLKQDVTGMKQDITGLKQDVAGIKNQQEEDHGILRALEEASSVHKAEIDSLTHGVAEIKGEVKKLSERFSEGQARIETDIKDLLKGQERHDKILERLAVRSIEQEAEIVTLRSIK